MKILITTECYRPIINGVVTSVVNLQSELERNGHEVRILTLSPNGHSFVQDGITYIGSVKALYPGVRTALRVHRRELQPLLDWQPDVVHSQCEFSTFRMARYIAGTLQIPIVHTYHTVYEDYTHYFSPSRTWGRAAVAWFSRNTLKRVQCVVAPTEKVHSLLTGYGVPGDIQVVPTGVDLEQFRAELPPERRLLLRKNLGLTEKDLVLVSVGRLAKEKNLEEILRFTSECRYPGLKLLIVGDGPHRHALERYAAELGLGDRVVFAGMVQPGEVADYYRLGELFVSASNSETQGLTYIEAMASGLPVLCRRDDCLKGVVDTGVNGWQYESFEQFEEALASACRDSGLLAELGRNARRTALERYSSSAFAASAEQLYARAVAAYSPQPSRLFLPAATKAAIK
ncbi:glycosyltransferase family 4 protein [Saccharibacillus alkalitolerans]|uniref:Glycosyltransferase family 4 protein n=1 Tax=Saccharibacillus alkalitolerans TaxID=2705290 RepID=A0ABX0FAC2_9BACL|nr:glycosyltransferase family 4 protein [Saccharibacillus alkalitolerans]NGZ76424.1 glycosyltransferase family 4 protein [Saccharibacillus alkalitolerans]